MDTARDGEAKDRGDGTGRGERPRRSTSDTSAQRPARSREDADSGHTRQSRPRLRASQAAQAAILEIHELTGRDVEGATSVQRNEDGWQVGVEVVESHRIPDTTDILAVYEATLDPSGELLGYRRVERYPRGRGNER
ncbi:gas vesicle protein GvpO [Parasphingorhabdus pacifica]